MLEKLEIKDVFMNNNLVEMLTFSPLSKKLVDSNCCPISLEPLKNAHVANCKGFHSFSLDSIVPMFGTLFENNQCTKPGPCPLCRGRVTSYYAVPALQEVVDSILGISKGKPHVEKMSVFIRESLK